MSADDLPELPEDARAALADAKTLVDPGEVVRARMRARELERGRCPRSLSGWSLRRSSWAVLQA